MARNHLLFADDCVLFERAKVEEWQKIQAMLQLYELASGQVLNKEKFAIFFSSNTGLIDKILIREAGGAVMEGSYEKYLGLPLVVGRSKYQTFRGVKERVWRKISNWKNSFLSVAGKEVLIKVFLQVVPTYTMSVFLLPKRLCNELNSTFAKFWWCNKNTNKGVHWSSWENLGQQKQKGGLGFRNVECFNLALLAK